MAILNERIRERREALGLSQADLAERLGYSDRSTIAKIESGINDITQSKIEAFAQVLHTTPAYLMGWDKKFTNTQAESAVLSLVCKELNLPQEALYFEDGMIKVQKEYAPLLPPGWEHYLGWIRWLIELNFPPLPQQNTPEFMLLTCFQSLNKEGRCKLLERAEELLELPKYRMDGNIPESPPNDK